jgi:hypothetical protein
VWAFCSAYSNARGGHLRGEFLRIGKVVNTMVDQINSFASEVTRVAKDVGSDVNSAVRRK